MGRQIHADAFLLFLEQLHLVGFHLGRNGGTNRLHFRHVAEQAHARRHRIVLELGGVAQQRIQIVLVFPRLEEILRTGHLAEAVEGAGIDQALDDLPVDDAQRHAFHEIEDAGKRTAFLPFGDHGVDDIGAHALDTAHAEADITLLVDRELRGALVDVGSQDLDLPAAAVVHDLGDLLHVVEVAAHVGGEELGGIMRFQVRRLVTDPGIAGCVRLVERIFRERPPVLPDLVEQRILMSAGTTTLHELEIQLLHVLDLLLAHGLSELVGLTLGKSGQLLRQQHHLLLIDRDAVGVLQVLFHLRCVVGDGLDALLAVYEVGNIIHRPRPVERIHCDQVFEALGLQLLQPLLHAGRLELEDRGGVAASVEFIGSLVVDGNGFDVDVQAVAFLDQVERLVDDRQGVEAQEVHLQQAAFLDIMAVVLGCPDIQARILVFRQADGNVIAQVTGSDDGGAGMHAYLPDAAFQLFGVFQDFLVERIVFLFKLFLEFGNQTEAVLQRNLDALLFPFALVVLLALEQAGRHHLREAVAFVDGHVTDARHILDGALGQHGAEGDDT